MKHIAGISLLFLSLVTLSGCFEQDDTVTSPTGFEIGYNLATYSHSADIPNQMMVVTSPVQLTLMWNYYTGLLIDAGETIIPAEPTIDFSSQTAIALFITDRSGCEHTLINGIIDYDELLSVRLKRVVNTSSSTSCVQVLDPRVYIITVDNNIAYPGKLYELFYDCIFCEV